ncbi:Pyruvate/ketoisovalerate oxidoreductase [Geobacter metallireducens RCH3]|uniref:2-oxoglutarate:ferredoxin oxidoreductase, gamma subunit n=1 Tax=Geobacter metallireducens (strain ATCC 53774 / DSM 7210 / GS-15) TaxID=269799 RepID=Q39VX6_GEOMG|nr:2-oxoacid:acceptor oxidoreductase family protein [Geobacter metallireducens]ABB31598.1 2-oxoglutarate:ferredoxin oxidoreductase, gamma subunit [Geobacter metallireducens GS-15]EHP86641.1 Pyruvate/ketoisovalerate oxidoreductase [Geobacter metallireducens RCH3]
MAGRYEIRFSGAGGQGLILAGVIMAEAASIYDGIQAVQSQSYGPEARGGASKSEVIISDGPIDYPKVTKCDALLALTQEACDKYSHDLKEGGLLLIDSDLVLREPAGNFKVTKFNITNTAKNEIGREIVTNIVALGAMVALTGAVTKEAAEKAVLARVPEAFLELNKKAFHVGFDKAMAAKA